METWLRHLVIGWMLLSNGLVSADSALTLEWTPEGVIARTHEGAIAWRVDRPLGGPRAREARDHTYEFDERGRILLDRRFLIERDGRLAARLEPGLQSGTDVGGDSIDVAHGNAFSWSTPVALGEGPRFGYSVEISPLIDSNGEVWAILPGSIDNGSSGFLIQLQRSVGHGGAWMPPETLYSTSDRIFGTAAVIDASGRITVAFRELSGGMNHVKALRYVPGAGWSGPQTLYSTDDFFQQVDAAVDAAGNVIVSFDPDSTNSMYAVVYDAVTESWSEPVRVPPETVGNVVFPTLIQNRAGTHIYAAYWVSSDPGKGIYVRRFRSPSLGWSSPRRVPGTASGGLPGGTGPYSFIPATVDDFGNLTMPFYRSVEMSPRNTLWILRAARLEAGAWVGPVTVTAHLDLDPSLVNHADADYSASGDVLLVFKRINSVPRRTLLMALHFDAAAGTWDAAPIYADPNGAEQRAGVAFRMDGSAIATYSDVNIGGLSSRLFDGNTWHPGAFPIPASPDLASDHETAAAGLDVFMAVADLDDHAFGTWFADGAPILKSGPE